MHRTLFVKKFYSMVNILIFKDWLLNKTVKATPAPVLPAPVLARAAPVPGPVGRFKYLQVVSIHKIFG